MSETSLMAHTNNLTPDTMALSESTGQTVHVIFCANPSYFRHTAVAMVSMAEACPAHPIHAHVFTCDHDPVSERLLRDTAARYELLTLEIHHVEDKSLDGLFVDRYLSRETYLRILAADILSHSLDRAIYLDSDLVVLDDIRLLWRSDLGTKLVGAVADIDFGDFAAERARLLGELPDCTYFNAGVLVIDLRRWQSESVTHRVIEYAGGRCLAHHDQDALNVVLNGNVQLLDTRWNLQAVAFSWKMRRQRPDYFHSSRAARRRPGIVHYTSSAKPWNWKDWCRRKELYRHFARKTAWGEPHPRRETRIERLEYALFRALLPLGIDLTVVRHAGRRLTRLPFRKRAVCQSLPRSEFAAEPIHVLFCADHRYFQHATVAALSVATAARAPICIHVITCDADATAEAMLREALCSCGRADVTVYRVDPDRLSGVFVDRHLTKEAYLRFLAPEVLPEDVRRVVYLDCDVIVLDDIAPLFAVGLRGKAVGAVPDCDWRDAATVARLGALGLGPGHVYVNSGVLVMDLVRWRREGLSAKLFHFASEQGARLVWLDQDALNAVLQDEIHLLDRRWNLQVLLLSRWAKSALPRDWAATAEARRRPAILHFSTEVKPWRFRAWTRRKALYFRFLDRTPWRHQRPAGLTLPQRLEYDLARRLLGMGLDIYSAAGAWRRVARAAAAKRRAVLGRARAVARPAAERWERRR